jgi:hypothetical protein
VVEAILAAAEPDFRQKHGKVSEFIHFVLGSYFLPQQSVPE